ncbi:MAG TPA: prepilin-type N-terminal cleavage/methylation domain-containing protein [Acidobacteriota bacterium]|nr:prepilin-type N-terminal cleavage/methylation domain-containing protein [Acidobacteriota bacterium]
MKNEQGFSLIELLIVVAIIAIIAAIAVPSMLQARMAANESSAIQGCRTIGSAEVAFAAINNQTYTDLTTLVSRGNLDSRFDPASGGLNGYTYAANTDASLGNTTTPDGFGFEADPQASKGRYMYGIGPDQVVRYMGVSGNAPSGTADAMCGAQACQTGDPIGMNKGAASGS